MNSITCVTGADATRQVRETIARTAATQVEWKIPGRGRYADTSVFVGTDHLGIVGSARAESGALAVFGSGVHGGAHPDDLARALLDAMVGGEETLRRALPPNTVVVASTSVGAPITAANGAQHRVFRYEHGTTFVASTEVGIASDGARADQPGLDIDRSREDFLLSYAFLPDQRTLAPGIDTVPADTDPLSLDARFTGPTKDELGGDPRDRLYSLLFEILGEQTAHDDAVGVLLGGVDSAIVASLLHRLGKRVHMFTFGFEETRYNQRNVEHVRRIVPGEHTWVPITVDAIADGLARYGDVYNQPVAQPHYLFHTLVSCEAMRDAGLRHAFSGDGADAAFLGYPTVNQRARLLARTGRVPRPVRRAAMRVASTRVLERLLGHTGRKVRAVLDQAEATGAARGHLPTPIFDAAARQRLRGDGPNQAESVEATRARLAEGLEDLEASRLALHGHGLIAQSRVKVEGAVAATGVAQSSPYLDPRLRAFAAGLDPEILRPTGTRAADVGKRLVLDMAERHDLLPAEVIHQPKQSPVDAPIDGWYAGPLRSEVLALLEHLPFEWDRGYVNTLLDGGILDGLYRDRVARLGHHILQPVGLLCTYAACVKRIVT